MKKLPRRRGGGLAGTAETGRCPDLGSPLQYGLLRTLGEAGYLEKFTISGRAGLPIGRCRVLFFYPFFL